MRLLILFEDANTNRDAVIGYEKDLMSNGWSSQMLNKLFDKASELSKGQVKAGSGGLQPMFSSSAKIAKKTTSDYYKELLQAELNKISKTSVDDEVMGDKGNDITDSDIPGALPKGQVGSLEAEPRHKSIKDESVIDVLKLLSKNLGPLGRDKTLVIAARFGIDSDLIEGAGLGTLPPNYNDEDVWNLLSISKGKKFINHTWQPFYMDALEDLKDLPGDIRDHIVDILTSEEAKEVNYPVKQDNSMVDDPLLNKNVRTTFEAKLVSDIIVEYDNSIMVIRAGSVLIVS